jgi:hypothetical protein
MATEIAELPPEPLPLAVTQRFALSAVEYSGLHVCRGRYVADMMSRVTIREVCGEFWRMSLDTNGVEWVESSMGCPLASLPVRLTARAGSERPA